jgi:NitT/TauT family transport system ATP-binding protein/nitrate/nitrite transport system substrate-binding protein
MTMSDVVPPIPSGDAAPRKLRLGLLRLTDGAPAIIANEFGFFADEGIEVDLVVEPSWANVADKLAFGLLDAAVVVPPLAFAVHLGLRGNVQPLVIPYSVSAGGNSVTLATGLAAEVRALADQGGMPTVAALAARLRTQPTTLGIVHAYSTHNLLLRYWLATAGIECGRDVKLAVVPPARAAEALGSGQIAGFCAGAPWGEVARRAGVGVTVAFSGDIWQNGPEKALAVRARWVGDNPDRLGGVVRALLRAARFCDDRDNASYTAAVLARPRYLATDAHAILAGLPGGPDKGCVFHRGSATFPWRSQGLWLLSEMRRWGLVGDDVDLRRLAEQVYRPDLYRSAVAPLDEPTPLADWKREGAHDAPWTIEGAAGPIVLPADRLCDGRAFDPDDVPPPSESAPLHKN